MKASAALASPPPQTDSGHGRRRRVGPLGVLLCLLSLASLPAGAQDLGAVQAEIADLEADAAVLLGTPVTEREVKSGTFVEERLTDGELFLRLEDYLRAAVILTDIVEHYPTHRAYPDALFLLGESLFAGGDELGARSHYAEIIGRAGESAFRPFVQPSLSRLIEIAIRTHDYTDIERYLAQLQQLDPEELSAMSAYFRAKYLYSRAVPDDVALSGTPAQMAQKVDRGRLEESLRLFSSIPEASPYGSKARYFVGVIHTLRGEYVDAIGAFSTLTALEAETDEQRAVKEQAYLALGRLYFEAGAYEQAVEAYRAVPQTSAQFDAALYELAWTHIRLGDGIRAERALELLSVAAPDSPHNADAKVLRGNLLAREGRFDEAGIVYEEVRDEFGPIRDELHQIKTENPDLHAYFRERVRANLDDFDLDAFLPEAAQRWVVLEGDYARALSVLSDLTQAKELVRETDALAKRLSAVLDSPNRLSVFSDLQRQQERSTALRNRVAKTRAALISEEASRAGPPRSPELSQVRENRERSQRDVLALPIDEEDFVERDGEILDRYRDLERQLTKLQVEILGLEARIVASNTVMDVLDPQKTDPAAIQASLDEQRAQATRYREQLEILGREIEVAKLQVGVGDPRDQRDQRKRLTFAELVDQERTLGVSGGPSYDAAYARLASIEGRLQSRDADLNAAARRRVDEMLRVVAEEQQNLVGYRQALASYDEETVEVVGAVTALNFDLVHRRFYDLVLEADVGRVDLAWARREGHRMRIDVMTRERARDIQALEDELRDVMDDPGANGQEDQP